MENESVRVLEVSLPPGVKEPMHIHKWPSVMIIDSLTDIRYFDEHGEGKEFTGLRPTTEWMEPEGLHAVENLDKQRTYHAIRIEIKK